MKIMLDLETLSTRPNAGVVAIGAVDFYQLGVGGRKFYRSITPKSNEAAGLHISASTFAWWCQQSDSARAVFSDKTATSLAAALTDFGSWCNELGVDEMWGNGSDFDNVILGNAYETLGLYRPWKYSQNRCYRTLKSLVPTEVANKAWNKWSTGVAHNALDDAVRQAHIAVDIYTYMALDRLEAA